MGKLSMAVFFVALMAAVVSSATLGAILEAKDISTVPSEVYAGTRGYLQVTLSNAGDTAASSATVYYDAAGTQVSSQVSDIPASSTSQIAIPFRINDDASGTVQVVSAQIFYTSDTGSSKDSRKLTISYPIRVSQIKPLEVATISIDKSLISPGEKIKVVLELRNRGGVVNNAVITASNASGFSLDGVTQVSVGSIGANQSRRVELPIASSSSAQIGAYNVPLLVTYQDALNTPIEQEVQVGPISMLENSATYRMTLTPSGASEIGSIADFSLLIENTGSDKVSIVVDVNSTDVFTPIGMQRHYFDEIAPGEKAGEKISLGIASGKASGYYTLPVTLTPSIGKSSTQYVGIFVSATPQITLSVENSQIQLTNTGNTAIRSVYAKVTQGFGNRTTTGDNFIGTLDVDDYATLTNGYSGSGAAEVTVTFRDSTNAPHSLTLSVEPGANAVGNFTGATAFRNNTARPGGVFGINPQAPNLASLALPAVGVIVVIVVGYFAYKKLYKGGKPK